jgi:hypothetical protein
LRSDHRNGPIDRDCQHIEVGSLCDRVARQAHATDPAPADIDALDGDAGLQLDAAGSQVGDPGIDPHLAGRPAQGAIVRHPGRREVEEQLRGDRADRARRTTLRIHGDHRPGDGAELPLELGGIVVTLQELPP